MIWSVGEGDATGIQNPLEVVLNGNQSITANFSQIPKITQTPGDRTAIFGETTSFAVQVTGAEPMSYQWKHNGQPIDGATGSSLTLNNVKVSDAGSYTVVVSNVAGSVESAAAAGHLV